MSATEYSLPATRPTATTTLISATVTAAGTSDAGCVMLDLAEQPITSRFALHIKTTGDATTAVGSSKTVKLYYAFSDESIANLTSTGAPLQFASNGESSLTVALRNATSAVDRNATAILEARGRYLYVWYDVDALTAGSTVAVVISIQYLG